ncbi:MAG: N-formylglutamate amidohydrolase [Azospirillaceae bacterium]
MAPPALDRYEPVVIRPEGRSPVVLLCDHAVNFVPPQLDRLGLPAAELDRHIAWDPGALPVAEILSDLLDAPLVHPTVSRLVIDCNRAFDAPDLIPTMSEATAIPGNQGLADTDRRARIEAVHRPFHAAIERLVTGRLAARRPTVLVSIHSFTPVFHGHRRPWQVGILFGMDTRLSAPLIAAITQAHPSFEVGANEPYAPADGVYHTLETHGERHGIASAMVEIRNDEIATPAQQDWWARLLGVCLQSLAEDVAVATPESRSA